jgi:hypothetical protein
MSQTQEQVINRSTVLAQIAVYIAAVQKINDEYSERNGFRGCEISVEYGKKNARIVHADIGGGSRSVHTFVNMDNGDILKAAGWKAPAPNGVSGNIFNENCDVGTKIGHYGAGYLR